LQQTAAPSQQGKAGPTEPKRTAERRSMTGALLKEVSEMKDRLMQVAKATRAVAKEVALSRTSNHRLSSGQASADLANFYSAEKKTAAKKTDDSDSSALNDLLDFFDQEPGGKANGKGTQLAALRAKVVGKDTKSKAGVHGDAIIKTDASSTPQIVAERTAKEKAFLAQKAASAKKAAAAHRLSSDAANKDITKYWGDFQAKTKAKAKVQDIRHHGMTSEAANKDLDSFLSKMVAKARVAHRATEAAANARRAKTNSGKEAVPVKHLTDKQARQQFEDWWGKDMATPNVHAAKGKGDKKGATKGDTTSEKDKSKGKGLATFSAATSAKELESFWDEEFPTPKKALTRPFEYEHHQQQHSDDKARSSEDGQRREERNEREAGRERRGDGEYDAASTVNSLGLPKGREEAVRISHSHRTSSEASRGDLSNYFGKMVRRDNIAAAKQRLKQHPNRPMPAGPAQALASAQPQYSQYAGYVQPQYLPYAQGVPAQAAPYANGPPQAYAQPVQGGWQQQPQFATAQQEPQVVPAPWPRTSLLDPMQAAFGAAYDGFLAAVDAEAKAGQGQMMGGMPAPPAQFAPAAPPVGTALGEMSAPLSQGPSGVGAASSWAWGEHAASPAPFKAS